MDVEHLKTDIFSDQFQMYFMASNKLQKPRLLVILFDKTFDLGLLHLMQMPSNEIQDMWVL